MGKQTPLGIRSDVLHRMVKDWVAAGCAVTIAPDGTIDVKPAPEAKGDTADLIDWRRK